MVFKNKHEHTVNPSCREVAAIANPSCREVAAVSQSYYSYYYSYSYYSYYHCNESLGETRAAGRSQRFRISVTMWCMSEIFDAMWCRRGRAGLRGGSSVILAAM